MDTQLTESTLVQLCAQRGILCRDVSRRTAGRHVVWEIGIEDGDSPEPDADDVVYVTRRPAVGWQVLTPKLDYLAERLPPIGIAASYDGQGWWVDTAPDLASLGDGLERLARALWYRWPVPLQ